MSFINRLKLLNNYLRQRPYASHGPIEIGIEVTNRCTLNCIMCNRQEMVRPLGDIGWGLFTQIVDQTYQTAEIYNLFGLGEPLLHPRLFDMIDYCHQKGVPVVLSTNATVLDQQAIKQLIDHPPNLLLLALDAHTPETHQRIRRGGNFYQIRSNIERYLKRHQERRPPTFAILLFVEQDLNEAEAADFKDYWRKKEALAIYIKPVTQMTNLKTQSDQPVRCLFPWRTLSVTWQGEAYPCCLDTNCVFNLGDIKDQPLETVWNGPNWRRLRDSFKNRRLEPLCRSCTIRKPSLFTTIAMSFLPELTIKKATPYLNRLQQLVLY